MKREEKAKKILKILNELFPKPEIPLTHRDPYTFLIAVILSQQCTDARVNQITPLLFEKAKTPKEMVKLGEKKIEDLIRPVGLAKTKARNIYELSKILVSSYDSEVPKSFDELLALPGVGRKTASVLVSQAFGEDAFAVDTHIHRLAKRWGLTRGKNREETENDLKAAFPKKTWSQVHLQMIYFGRSYCPARNHNPADCPICSWAMEK
ncbi:endonuclease III [Criblamydia sequanensis]|uniref:Endonuclease III n=1 Tax=Candidatus Criblamydia sequanensis CRIB-18 TaxID=1437425 RepID=A0A090CZI8_9BACT|nr:endonuclease III [Criblamydia sequanensis]CDR34336.1 Endonuclease III [Criblamydia sequanensis CRIB-18]